MPRKVLPSVEEDTKISGKVLVKLNPPYLILWSFKLLDSTAKFVTYVNAESGGEKKLKTTPLEAKDSVLKNPRIIGYMHKRKFMLTNWKSSIWKT